MKFSTGKITAIIFILVLGIFFFGILFSEDRKFSESENRVLQGKPSFSVSKYIDGRFERKTEDYVNDQFPFRDLFVGLKSVTDVLAGKLEANGVYRCKDNYLMDEISAPGKHFANTENALNFFRRKHKHLATYFLLAPNAANVYHDKLPNTVRLKDQNRYIDEFYRKIARSGYKCIDIRRKFAAEKNNVQLYYRTDHHWTSDGAYIAYKYSAKSMGLTEIPGYDGYVVKKDFKGTLYSKSGFVNGLDDKIKIFLPENKKNHINSVIYYADTKKKTTNFYQLKNLKKKDAYTVFGGSNHPLYTIQTPCDSKRNLLLIKDSYANSMIPFLSQHYKRIVVVDPRYFYDSVKDLIASNGITDVLFLYNANTFFLDNSLEMMLRDS